MVDIGAILKGAAALTAGGIALFVTVKISQQFKSAEERQREFETQTALNEPNLADKISALFTGKNPLSVAEQRILKIKAQFDYTSPIWSQFIEGTKVLNKVAFDAIANLDSYVSQNAATFRMGSVLKAGPKWRQGARDLAAALTAGSADTQVASRMARVKAIINSMKGAGLVGLKEKKAEVLRETRAVTNYFRDNFLIV